MVQNHTPQSSPYHRGIGLTVATVVLRVLGIDSDGVRVVGVSVRQLGRKGPIPYAEAGKAERGESKWRMNSVHSQLGFSFLGQSILSDGLERLLDVDSFFGRSFEVWDVSLSLTPCHGSFLRDLVVSACSESARSS